MSFITKLVPIVSILALIGSVGRLLDSTRRALLQEHFGSVIGKLDLAGDTVLFFFSIALLVGYHSQKKWAYKATFYYFGIYMVGLIAAGIIIFVNPETLITYMNSIRPERAHGVILPFINYIIVAAIVVYGIFSFFILRSIRKNKDFFSKE